MYRIAPTLSKRAGIVLSGSVAVAGRRRVVPGPMRCRGLLAALALHPNQVISYDRLTTMLWDEPITSARSNLRTLAAGIRCALDEAGIGDAVELRTHRAARGGVGGYSLEVDPDKVDLLLAGRLKQRAKDLVELDPLGARRLVEEAMAADAGGFGPDLPASLWFQRQQERFTRFHDSLCMLQWCLSMIAGEFGDESGCLDQIRQTEMQSTRTELIAAQLYFQGFATEALERFRQASAMYREFGLDLPDSSRRMQMEILNDDKRAIIDRVRAIAFGL